MENTTHLWIPITSLLLACFLAICHYLPCYIQQRPHQRQCQLASFAGGFAIAFVFLHMMPELTAGKEIISEIIQVFSNNLVLMETLTFLIALIGFTIYYGVELISLRQQTPDQPKKSTYLLHMMMQAVFNFIITYTMATRIETGLFFAIIFTLSMGLHFMLTDRHMRRHFPQLFTIKSRLVFMLALIAGALVSWIVGPEIEISSSFLIAILAGIIMYQIFREELPNSQDSNFNSFCIGIFTMTIILIAQILVT